MTRYTLGRINHKGLKGLSDFGTWLPHSPRYIGNFLVGRSKLDETMGGEGRHLCSGIMANKSSLFAYARKTARGSNLKDRVTYESLSLLVEPRDN